jgi:hypothetical protein
LLSPKYPSQYLLPDALIDLGCNPARDWAEQATQRVVSEYTIDYFKTSYTLIVTQCQQTNHRQHYGVDLSYWSALGYYAAQEALLRKFPDLINEGCSGSGHIKDFADIRRVHTIAMNDTLSILPNRQGICDSSLPSLQQLSWTTPTRTFTLVTNWENYDANER